MVSQTATSLRESLDQKMRELAEALAGIEEAKAGERGSDSEWCCKEVLSHLMGDEGFTLVAPIRRFIEEDTPLIPIVTGLPYYAPSRQELTSGELLSAVQSRYSEAADFLAGLSDEQLARKARVPLFKETPIGEYPTVPQFVGALSFHLADHINQIRTARQRVEV